MEDLNIGDFVYIHNTCNSYVVKLTTIVPNSLDYFPYTGVYTEIILYTSDKSHKLFKTIYFNLKNNKKIYFKKIEDKKIIEELTIKYNVYLLQES